MSNKVDSDEEDLAIEQIDSEIQDSDSEPVEFEIATFPADFTLEVLYNKMKSEEIKIPKFQRGFVWTISQSSRLIESFMLGLPVPQIFLYSDPEQKSLVIDGQQRLKSIFYFFEGFFGEPDAQGRRKVFALEGINEKSRWYDKKFEDFTEPEKRKLKMSVLRSIMVKQLDPQDDTSIYHIFERLNTGGTLLMNQEVRNCVYGGNLNELMLVLNTYPPWRMILGKHKLDKRQKDIELILRYIALYHSSEKYTKPMKDYLSRFMKRNRNLSTESLQAETARFQKTCDSVLGYLGEKSFAPRGALNAAVFDSVFTTFSRHLDHIPSNIEARYGKLLGDPDFDKFTRKSTTDIETVKGRLKKAEEILFAD